MTRLADHEPVAHIRRRHEAQGTHERRRAVGQDVAVEVGRDDDVVGSRLPEEFVDHGVDDLLFDGDGGVFGGSGEGGAGGFAEEAVGLREDVGFVGDCDCGAGVDAAARDSAGIAYGLPAQGDFPCHGGDAARCAFRDAFDRLGDLAGAVGGVKGAFLLDVEVLGVFAHDDEVDGGFGGRDGLHGADVGVEVELLAQGNDGGRVAGDFLGRRGNGAEEGSGAFRAQGVDGFWREGGAGGEEVVISGRESGECEG
ncbi:MAG: hypothetical protein LQ341_006733 [Variospora aurantia]|nr:MAG: hypothetical protein LQ341_006733 [Variospora aurantia]